jgi:Tfp pilus assembly protein PilF
MQQQGLPVRRTCLRRSGYAQAGKTLAGGSNPHHTGVINVAPTKHQINFNGLWMAMPSWRIKKKIEGELVDWLILFFVILPFSVGTYQRNAVWESNLKLWKDCVKKSPQKERVHHNLGFAYFELGKWDDAEKEFEEALRLNPKYALSMYNLGLVFYKKGFMDKAIHYYQKAIEYDPNFSDSFYNLGLAYYKKGLYKDAVEAYKKLLEVKPDYENAYNNMGLAYKGLKKWDKAIQSFHEGLKYHPDNVYAHLYLGESYEAIKNYSMALVHYKKALEDPNLPDAENVCKVVLSMEASQKLKKGKED